MKIKSNLGSILQSFNRINAEKIRKIIRIIIKSRSIVEFENKDQK